MELSSERLIRRLVAAGADASPDKDSSLLNSLWHMRGQYMKWVCSASAGFLAFRWLAGQARINPNLKYRSRCKTCPSLCLQRGHRRGS